MSVDGASGSGGASEAAAPGLGAEPQAVLTPLTEAAIFLVAIIGAGTAGGANPPAARARRPPRTPGRSTRSVTSSGTWPGWCARWGPGNRGPT